MTMEGSVTLGPSFSFFRSSFFLHALSLSLLSSLSLDSCFLTLQDDPLDNAQLAIDTAFDHFDIPRVIDASDMASDTPDELVNMTYLSYFRDKVNLSIFRCLLTSSGMN